MSVESTHLPLTSPAGVHVAAFAAFIFRLPHSENIVEESSCVFLLQREFNFHDVGMTQAPVLVKASRIQKRFLHLMSQQGELTVMDKLIAEMPKPAQTDDCHPAKK